MEREIVRRNWIKNNLIDKNRKYTQIMQKLLLNKKSNSDLLNYKVNILCVYESYRVFERAGKGKTVILGAY